MTDDRRWVVEGEANPFDLEALVAAHNSGALAGKSVRLQGPDVDLNASDLASLAREASGQLNVTAPPSAANYPRGAAPQAPVNANDDPMRFVLPVNPSGWALISGYLGLGSALCIFGPFAILTAILAFNEIKKDPTKTGKGRAIFGLVMGIIGTIGLIVILIGMLSKPSVS